MAIMRVTSASHFFSPLYDFARRKLNITPVVLERSIAAEGVANVQGRNVTIRYKTNGGTEQVITGYLKWPTRKAKLARWALRYNGRSLMGDKKHEHER